MNRSILIVICDFLLLSLLTFSTDMNHIASDDTQRTAHVDVNTNTVAVPGNDLNTMMKQALEDERQSHSQLQQQLAAARASAGQQQTMLSQTEQKNAQLQQQFATAQTNLESLNQQLQTTAQQARNAQQQLTTTEATAQQQADLAAQLRRQLDDLTRSNLLSQAEKQRLAGQLQLAEEQRQAAADRASLMQQEVQATRAENTKLTAGLQTLATNSTQLTQEIRDNRALAPNAIFSDFATNRVQANILAARTGFFSIDYSKNRQTQTILVSDGKETYAICHVDDTPITFWDPGTDWQGLTGTLFAHGAGVPIQAMSFASQDPRVVMMPVSSAEAQQLGCKVYHISSTPFRFQDAIIVGANEGYYGQCNFQIDLNTPQYVKLDRSFLRGLFGKFNPSRGDIVFSRGGDLIGIMVNSSYCLVIHNFAAAASLTFAPDVRQQHTGTTLARLYGNVFQLPLQLQ
jgi:hypothetical protein